MRRFPIPFIVAILLLMNACAPAVAPTPNVNTKATVNAIAQTIVAGTLTAQPTSTPAPTNTPQPTGTPTIPPTETMTPMPALTDTSTPVPFNGTLAPAGLNGTLPTKTFIIQNYTSETLRVSIYGVSSPGDKPVYYAYNVTGSYSFQIVWGTFNYTVMVGNKKTFTGSFKINNYDKTVMQVYDSKPPHFVGP